MPKVAVYCPDSMYGFAGSHEHQVKWDMFLNDLRTVVAREMSANNEGGMVTFDPLTDVDVVTIPYSRITSRPTATVLIEIITYDWPERSRTMNARLQRILEHMAPFIPAGEVHEGESPMNATFLTKGPGCWAQL